MIPVSINQHYYCAQKFVERINQGYSDADTERAPNDARSYSVYTDRNISGVRHKPMLALLYDYVSPCEFNGISRWTSCFTHYQKVLNDRFGVQDYLNDVLVLDLNRYLLETGVRQLVYCQDFRDYIHACIKYKYAPLLDIRWNDEKGWGVYVLEELYPFTFIGLYTGQLSTTFAVGLKENITQRHNKYVWLMTYNSMFCIDAQKKGNFTRFINHDDDHSERVVTFSIPIAQNDDRVTIPHAGFMIGFNSVSNIKAVFEPEEELVWDYGSRYQFD